MIAPAYRRDQLWGPARRDLPASILAGAIVGGAFMLLLTVAAVGPARSHVSVDDSPRSAANLLVTKLVDEGFPAWREHHAGCPRRSSQLLRTAHLDPWGHALHYTCDPRLASGGTFAVFSAGEDGVFGTADDIEAHR